MSLIHPTAIVSKDAHIGKNVSIGAFTTVYGNVKIGDDSVIESYCEVGYATPRAEGRPLVIGKGARIRSHSIFYEGSSFGAGLITGHHVTVREGVVAGLNLQIGSYSDIQGKCTIGDYVRFHSGVFVSQHTVIGNFVWLFPRVVLTEDPHPPSNYLFGVTIEDYAAIAAGAVIMPGIRVGEGSLVGAHSLVSADVEKGMVVYGVPAKPICEASKIKLKDGSGRPAYPWTTHFHRGYPEEIVKKWIDSIPGYSSSYIGGK